MIIEILKPHGKWAPGAKVDVLRSKAEELFSLGVACQADDQTALDRIPAKEAAQEPEPIVVNNYFITEEPKPQKGKNKISSTTKK